MDYRRSVRGLKRSVAFLVIYFVCSGMFDSTGGAQDSKLKSFTVTMNGSIWGDEYIARYTYQSPDQYRMDVSMEDGEITGVCDHGDCWNLADGIVDDMDEEGKNQLMQAFAHIIGSVESIRTAYGAQVETAGTSSLNGRSVEVYQFSGMHKMDTEFRGKVFATLYIDTATGFPVKLVFDYAEVDDTTTEMEYGVVNGCAIMQAMRLTEGGKQKALISMENTVVNGPIDPQLFQRP